MASGHLDLLKTSLTQLHRRLIMASLILVFFIISPTIILYTAGFRLNAETGLIESTGGLSIDVEPDDAEVYVNDVHLTDKLPIRLSSLAPGTYSVRIGKPGFHTLAKDFSVQSGQTTYVKDISLLKNTEPQKIKSLSETVGAIKLKDANPLRYETTTNTEKLAATQALRYVDDDKNIWVYTATSTIKNSQNPKKYFGFNREKSPEQIIYVSNNFALLRLDHDILLIKNPGQPNQQEKNISAENWHYHAATKEWRLASAWEITSVYENGNDIVLYRSDEPMQSVHPLDPDGDILIVANNRLVAFNPWYYISQELARFDRIDAVDTDENERLIIIAGTWRGERGVFTLTY